MRQPKSYVVRIYRQGARSLTGVVEDVRNGEQRPFSDAQELWTILRRPSPKPTRFSAGRKPA
ncbi:MAG: hypothetical protein ABL878_02100 [Burkholderiales bacterium]